MTLFLCCQISTVMLNSGKLLQGHCSVWPNVVRFPNCLMGNTISPENNFWELAPSPSQIAKEYLVKNGRVIGYMTGGSAFSQYSLTTQISSDILIGTNYYRRPIQRGPYKISFVYQPNEINEDNIELLKLLDCLKYIKDIPGTTANEACKRLIFVIKDLTENKESR